jgi:hypothetical protein
MAQSKNNIITHGLSGKIGDLIVFRTLNGKTIVANKPAERKGAPSEGQKQNQKRFQQAIIYAKSAVADPALKEEYKAAAKEGESPYNVAVADFMHAPDISEVNVSKYNGKAGGKISITVTDDFKVAEVFIIILNQDGTEVEEGSAQPTPGGVEWIYTATANNDSLTGDKIIIRASDLPGHTTELEQAF